MPTRVTKRPFSVMRERSKGLSPFGKLILRCRNLLDSRDRLSRNLEGCASVLRRVDRGYRHLDFKQLGADLGRKLLAETVSRSRSRIGMPEKTKHFFSKCSWRIPSSGPSTAKSPAPLGSVLPEASRNHHCGDLKISTRHAERVLFSWSNEGVPGRTKVSPTRQTS